MLSLGLITRKCGQNSTEPDHCRACRGGLQLLHGRDIVEASERDEHIFLLPAKANLLYLHQDTLERIAKCIFSDAESFPTQCLVHRKGHIPRMQSSLRFVGAWTLVAFYVAGISIGSSLSHPPVISTVDLPYFDKFCHSTEYGGLTFLLIRALSLTYATRTSISLAVWAAVLVILYGASDELHQAFTPNRVMSGYDLLADATAAGVVAGVWLWARRRWPTVVK
jgi:VanZ family protein